MRRVRKRTLRRWVAPGLGVLALLASLFMSMRRGEAGRRLAAEFATLESRGYVAADRIARQRARVDSLTTLARIEDVAGSIGLRQAVGSELVRVEAADREENEVAASEVGGER